MRFDAVLETDDFAQALDKPRVDFAGLMNFADGQTHAQCLPHLQQPVGGGCAQRRENGGAVIALPQTLDFDFIKAIEAGFQRAQRLLHTFIKGAANGHGLTHRLHRRGQNRLGAGEFFKGEARNFGDDIVNGRLERGGCGPARDIIGDFVECIAHGELGRHFGNGKAGGLRGQRRGARDARIHLNDDHLAIGRIDRELHIGAAGFHADLPQHRQRGVAHDLIFFIGEGEGGGNGD